MTTDEAIAFIRAHGWVVMSLSENMASPGWRARLINPQRNREVGSAPGFNDALTDYGDGATPAEAILRAIRLRYDRQTGKVVEVEVPPFSPAAEGRLCTALDRAVEARNLKPLDLITKEALSRLDAALSVATHVRSRGRKR